MAVSVAVVARDVSSLKRVIAALTFSGTYTTGGEVSSAGFKKDLAMTKFHIVHFSQDDADTAQGLVARYNRTTDKVMLYEGGAAADSPMKELTSGASLTNVVIRAEFVGEGNN